MVEVVQLPLTGPVYKGRVTRALRAQPQGTAWSPGQHVSTLARQHLGTLAKLAKVAKWQVGPKLGP